MSLAGILQVGGRHFLPGRINAAQQRDARSRMGVKGVKNQTRIASVGLTQLGAGSRSYTSHPDRNPTSRGFRKRRAPMASSAEAIAEFYADKNNIEFMGIRRALRDFRPETEVEDDPYMPKRSWYNRPQWYRSTASWTSDPANDEYERFVRGVTTMKGDFKKAPTLYRTFLNELATYYGKDSSTSAIRLLEILDWHEKEDRNPYTPGVPKEPEPVSHIKSWLQKIRIMKREDRKDFWRAFPPYESWLRPRAYAEPDPHMHIGSDSLAFFLMNGSAIEDNAMAAKNTLQSSILKSLFFSPVTRYLFGSGPMNMVENLIERSIAQREEERRTRQEPGSPHRPTKDLFLSYLPGWNHATHLFDYGRRDTATRVMMEDDELMARVPPPSDSLDATPPHIQQLHRWRSLPDPVYSKFAHIGRDVFRESMTMFLKGDNVGAGNILPDRVRVDKAPTPRPVNHWMYYVDPEEAYVAATGRNPDAFQNIWRQEAFEESPLYISAIKQNPIIARLFGIDRKQRVAINIAEHQSALDQFSKDLESRPFYSAWTQSFRPLFQHARMFLDPSMFGPSALYHNFRYLLQFHKQKHSEDAKMARNSDPSSPHHPTIDEAIDILKRNYSVKEHINSYVNTDKLKERSSFVMSGRPAAPPGPQRSKTQPNQRRQYSTVAPQGASPPKPEIPAGAHLHHLGTKAPPAPSIGEKAQVPKTWFDRFESVMLRLGEAVDAWWYKKQEKAARQQREYTHPMDRDYNEGWEHHVMYPPNPDRSPSRLFLEWRLMRDRALKAMEKENEAKRRVDPSFDPDKRPLAELKRERIDLDLSWILWYGLNWYDHMDPMYGPDNLAYDPKKLPKLPEVVIDWTKVPEDIALLYKILKQWDHITDGDLPLEYYELVWLLQWHDEGYDDVELPERFEVIMLQRAPEYMLPREAAAAHDWLMRKEAADGNQFKLLFTGPEPKVPELDAIGEAPPTEGEHSIYVVGKDEVPRSLLLASGLPATPLEEQMAHVTAAKSKEAEAPKVHEAPPSPPPRSESPPPPSGDSKQTAQSAPKQPEPAAQSANPEAPAAEAPEQQEETPEDADQQTTNAVEKRRRKKRSAGDELHESMLENRREAAQEGATGLVLREDKGGADTSALATFFESLSTAVSLHGMKGDPSGGRSAGAKKIANDLFNYVGEIVDFQTYVRKFYPLFDVKHWEDQITHLLGDVCEDVVDQRFNLPRLVANTAVYNRWIEWAVQRRIRSSKLNVPMPHFMKMTHPSLSNVAMMDGIPFVTFTWEIQYRSYFREDKNYKLGLRPSDNELRYSRKELDKAGKAVRQFKPFGAEFIPFEKPTSKIMFSNRSANVSCVVVVDVRTAQYGSIMAWNWNLED
eukprot:TRINITY_DN4910_c0_g1_i1.p1 TRINITY_DN4910_c0_g1~~TRINITY_DN4910_c0_g1_i1.p1  ORF type:complete len:1360 (-),score=238.18 TRINITY_DN4910_c0_g1_i1:131-4210(-)